MPKPKHLFNIGDRVRITEERLPHPVGHEFTVTEIRHGSNGALGPFWYGGSGVYFRGGQECRDPGVWEKFLERVEPARTDVAP